MDSASVALRVATLADVPDIGGIEDRVFGNPWAPDAYAQEVERPTARVELAEVGGVVTGYSCTWWVSAGGETEGHLLRIAVAPEAQGRGVGRDLLAAVLTHGRARGVGATRVLLEVAHDNTRAIDLYEHAGFRTIGRRAGYYKAPPADAVVMECRLLPAAPACESP